MPSIYKHYRFTSVVSHPKIQHKDMKNLLYFIYQVRPFCNISKGRLIFYLLSNSLISICTVHLTLSLLASTRTWLTHLDLHLLKGLPPSPAAINCPQLYSKYLGFIIFSPFHAMKLTGLILYRPCSVNYCQCEIMSVVGLLGSEDAILLQSSTTSNRPLGP